jgi:hypothetical protein
MSSLVPPLTARRALVVGLAAVTLGVGLSACGSGGSAATTNISSNARYQARLNLAKCFRSHGINVPDPTPGGGPAAGFGAGLRSLRNYPTAQVNAARQACNQYLIQAFPQLNLSPAQRAQVQQQLVKFAQCMRSHGIDVPDPTFNGNGGFGIGRTFRNIDRNSPGFQSALSACRNLRPSFGGRGPGGGGPGGGGPGGPGG